MQTASTPPWYQLDLRTIITSIGIILAAIYFWLNQRKNWKRIEYDIVVSSLVHPAQQFDDRLKLTFDGEVVRTASIVKMELSNTGSIEIKAGDFESPIEFWFRSGEVMTFTVADRSPAALEPQVNETIDHAIRVAPLLLNTGDSLTIVCLVRNMRGEVEVKGRIAGVKRLNKKKQIKDVYRTALWEFVSPLVIFSAALIGGWLVRFTAVGPLIIGVFAGCIMLLLIHSRIKL